VSAAQEIAAQVRGGALPPPDVIYVALGSAGTVAGLTFARWGERAPEIVGVKVVDSIVASAGAVRRLERGLARLIGRDTARLQMGRPPRLRVAGGFLGRGFGHASPASEAAVTQAARLGLRLDPIYTGKVMAALLDDARRGRLDGKRVLFLHTFNTVDLAPLIARGPGPSALPAPLRKLFDTPAPAAALAT
jgi:D-cysteine desulfhydrase